MQHKAFVQNYLHGRVDYDWLYGYQCTDLVKQYAKDVLLAPIKSFNGSACNADERTFGNKYIKIIPWPWKDAKQGDIVIQDKTKRLPYGHTGIINSADHIGYYLLEQNAYSGRWSWLGKDAIRVTFYKRSDTPVKAFWRVKR